MFNSKTVFVVGAGASSELNLPIGSELTNLVARKLRFSFEHGEQKSGSINIIDGFRGKLRGDQSNEKLNSLARAGRSIAEAMPLAPSIDNFLHTHSHDSSITTIGKAAIAECIFEAERGSTIYVDPRSNGQIDFGSRTATWHTAFTKMLLEGRLKTELDNLFDNIGIITFNYDRCIEHYILHALASYLRINLAEAESLACKLDIIHPYGQVGFLPWQKGGQGFPFGVDLAPHFLVESATQLRTFTERIDDDAMLARMRQMLSTADKVIYLGFAFGHMNMQLMRLQGQPSRKYVLGTALGVSDANQKAIIRDINDTFAGADYVGGSPILSNERCLDLFNSYWRDISG